MIEWRLTWVRMYDIVCAIECINEFVRLNSEVR